MRGVATALFAVLALGLAGTAAAEATKRPTLRIVSMAPLTVRGLSFKPGEPVKLLVVAGKPLSRAVKAGPRGGFVARLGVEVKGCQAVVVQAIGARGSRAMVDVTTPGCDEKPD
jgi:hypothetical protein